ncbi:Hypothetical predicted protein, partial [Paramuricea clavata]
MNPELGCPYRAEAEQLGVPDTEAVVKNLLAKGRLPQHGTKYEKLRMTSWWQLEEIFNVSTNFDPVARLSAARVLSIFNNHLSESFQMHQVCDEPKDISSFYDVQEAYAIMSSKNLLDQQYEFSEECVSGNKVFSCAGRYELVKSLESKASLEKCVLEYIPARPTSVLLQLTRSAMILPRKAYWTKAEKTDEDSSIEIVAVPGKIQEKARTSIQNKYSLEADIQRQSPSNDACYADNIDDSQAQRYAAIVDSVGSDSDGNSDGISLENIEQVRFYNNDPALPVYRWGLLNGLSTDDVAAILLKEQIHLTKIATSVPTCI